jgi:ketosteroid isomerase-like protein
METTMARRLKDAIDAHELEPLVALFDDHVRSEQPIHPDRAFEGSAQIRENWRQLFAGVPDLRAVLIRSFDDGGTTWAEWDWQGTRRDGSAFQLRGVTIVGVEDGRIGWVRFYLDPVDTAGVGIDAAIRVAAGTGR